MNDESARSNPTRTFYDRISRVYDRLADADEHVAREKGLQLLGVAEGERVLEVGFGTGHALVDLARAVGSSGSVDGVDISTGMLAVAGHRLKDEGLSEIVKLQIAETPPLPYDDASFDAVTLSFTLELFSEATIPAMLAEIRRVLVPSGRIGVVSMADVEAGERESFLTHTYKWLHRHFPHIVDCQPIPVRQVVEDAGFTIENEFAMSIWTLKVEALVGRAPG